MWRAARSAASKDFLRRKVPSPTSTERPARRSSRARARAAGLRSAHGRDVGVEFGRFEVQGSRFEGVLCGLGLEGEDEAVLADGEADAGGLGPPSISERPS